MRTLSSTYSMERFVCRSVEIKFSALLSLIQSICMGVFLRPCTLCVASLKHLTPEEPQLQFRGYFLELSVVSVLSKDVADQRLGVLSASLLSLYTGCGKKEYNLF